MENVVKESKKVGRPKKIETNDSSNIIEASVEGLSPVLGSVVVTPMRVKTPESKTTRTKRISTSTVRKTKEEMDPGELVSIWHKMNKKYQAALDSLTNVANQLDELSKELENNFGIKVPNAKRLEKASNQPVQSSFYSSPEETYTTEIDSSWSPPVQTNINTSTAQNPIFVEQMRKDAFEMEGSSDQSFAASIAEQFNNIMGSLK